MQTREISVPDISCGHCKASIEQAVGPVAGVQSVNAVVDRKMVVLEYDGEEATFKRVVDAIEAQGFTVA